MHSETWNVPVSTHTFKRAGLGWLRVLVCSQKMPPAMAAYLTPTAAEGIPLILSLSPDGGYLAVALRNNVVEVRRCRYSHSNNVCILAYNTYADF